LFAVETAKAAAGADYLYGGKTTAGFDCSGFVFYVFHHVFPEFKYLTADEIAASNLFTKVEAYRPGDLVFFPSGKVEFEISRKNNKVFPSHIGIVFDHGNWIGSQSSTGVDRVAFNNVWWNSRSREYRRYLKIP
jgi:peptidoglycan endopeptidase LytE